MSMFLVSPDAVRESMSLVLEVNQLTFLERQVAVMEVNRGPLLARFQQT
jgi:hypothetical protein